MVGLIPKSTRFDYYIKFVLDEVKKLEGGIYHWQVHAVRFDLFGTYMHIAAIIIYQARI